MFKFQAFSRKQRQIFTWWADKSPVKDAVGIIADGAIRSGKTVSMSLSYVMWAMSKYDGQNFIMAGKTISSFKRNVLQNLKLMLTSRGYHWIYHISGEFPNMLEVTRNGKTNYFYIFGGKDEGSQDLVQGITAAGAFFDEVALMPESFVNQATGRCSVEGATWWFNCNPAGPMHWFKLEWIDKRKKKRLLYLHFTMDDNLSLSEKVKEKYREMYAGVFYLRYIKGMWAVAEGLIYTMLTKENLYTNAERPAGLKSTAAKTITVDYGTTNPCVFLEVWDDGETLWIDREYRWDSRSEEARRSGRYGGVYGSRSGRPVYGRCGSISSLFHRRAPQPRRVCETGEQRGGGRDPRGRITFSKAEHPDQQRKLQGTARRDAVLRLGRQGGRTGRGKAREAKRSRPGCVKILLLYGPSKVADRGIGGS